MPLAGSIHIQNLVEDLHVQEAGTGVRIMETFLITLAVIGMSGGCFWLFVIEPRRKIYDR
jgi:hypothetical protein